jgi:hypothetical protein
MVNCTASDVMTGMGIASHPRTYQWELRAGRPRPVATAGGKTTIAGGLYIALSGW